MYRTQHNDGREGDREVRKRGSGEKEGDKERVEVIRRKEEEREGTEGERKIRHCKVIRRERERERGREGGMERERGREVGRKKMEKSKRRR